MKKQVLFRLYRVVSGELPLYAIYLLGFAFSQAALQMILAFLLRDMFEAIAHASPSSLIRAVSTNGCYLLLCIGLVSIFYWLLGKVTAQMMGQLRIMVFDKVQVMPISYFKSVHSGDLTSRLTNDMAATERIYTQLPQRFFSSTILGLASMVLLVFLSPLVAVISLGIGLTGFVINMYFSAKLRATSRNVQQGLARVNEMLTDLLSGMQIVKSFNLGRRLSRDYREQTNVVYQHSMHRIEHNAALSVCNNVLGTVSFLGICGLASYLMYRGELTVGSIIAVTQLQNYVRQMFNSLDYLITGLQSALAAGERLLELIDTPAEPASYAMPPCASKGDEVVFENVSFAFDDANVVIENMSFSARKGEIIALTGPSGGGKSTALRLLLGFYPLKEGSIAVGGRTFSEQTLDELRQKISFVPQDSYLFAGSIAENIRYARPDATMEEVVEAAKVANAHEFIIGLEKGYDTLVGERGAELSGGQRQRIAIARALIKDAPILLLDEATSSLDSESEYLVQEALNRLMQGRTTIAVAHRLSTIEHADRILVLASGRIAESGSHHELLQQENSIYRRLAVLSAGA